MKWYIILFILIVLIINPTQAQQTGSLMPEKISYSNTYTAGYGGFAGSRSAILRDGGISRSYHRIAGVQANLIYLGKVDFSSYFANIDFSAVKNWQIRFNESALRAYDLGSSRIKLVLHFSSFSVTIDQFTFEDPISLSCNYQAACQFVSAIRAAVRNLEQFSSVVLMHPVVFLVSSLLLLFFPVWIWYNRHKEQYSPKFVGAHIALYLFVSYFVFVLIYAFLKSIDDFFSVFLSLVLSLITTGGVYWLVQRVYLHNSVK